MEVFRRINGIDGYTWESENYEIIRSGGTDRRGHYNYNLGAYGLQDWDGEFWGWFDTLREAKEYTDFLAQTRRY